MVKHGIELPTEDTHCRIGPMLTPDSALNICREQLGTPAPATRKAWQGCAAIEALYHPGRYLRVAYVLLADEAVPPQHYWPRGDIVYLHWPVRTPTSRRDAVLRIDGCEVEAYCFPNDRRLRRLRSFARRKSAFALWRKWAERWGVPPEAEPEALRRELIRYVPEQKFLGRIQVRTPSAHSGRLDRSNIAVRSSSPKVCPVLVQRHNTAARWARDKSKHLCVPEAILADPAGGIIVFEWVHGRSLLEKLQTGDSACVMRRMARTVHSFHRLPAEGLGRLLSADVRRRVEDAVVDLAATCPELKSRLALLASTLRGRLAEIGQTEHATLHDDLHWNQVRIRQRHYALLDLERMCAGDPLIDVANFATQVRMLGHRADLGVDPTCATRWAGEFLEHWATTTGRRIAANRFHLYAAVSLLKLARGMMRHLRPGWRALARLCVEEAEAELSSIERSAAVP
jgi:hypothetical protein